LSDETQYITEEYLAELEAEMLVSAEALEFERAAALRDRIQQMRSQVGKKRDEVEVYHATRAERGRHRQKLPAGTRVPKPKKG
jgi:excinuclease ABC subunit B